MKTINTISSRKDMESPFKHEVNERTSSVKTRKELMVISTAKKESNKRADTSNKNNRSQENHTAS